MKKLNKIDKSDYLFSVKILKFNIKDTKANPLKLF